MNLKLDTNPLDSRREKVLNPPPKPQITPQPTQPPDAPAAAPLFRVLPRNACDVIGCKKYGHSFPSPQALLEHARAVHQRRSAEHRSAPIQTQEPMKAEQCAETFPSGIRLAQHARLVHKKRRTTRVDGKLRWPCPDCGHLASSAESLANHQHAAHSKSRPEVAAPSAQIQCPACTEVNTRTWIGRHFCRAHKGEIFKCASDCFECTDCGATFVTRSAADAHCLKQHGRIRGLVKQREPSAAPTLPPVSSAPVMEVAKQNGLTHYAVANGPNGQVIIHGTEEQIFDQSRALLKFFNKVEIGLNK
jgi:hypothetical protein